MSGPVPPESNPPIQPQFYSPSVFQISAISLGQNTTVTTTVDHNYVVGQQVRLHIPNTFRSIGLNGKSGYVISIPAADQVTTDIFSVGVDPFVSSPSYYTTPPQIAAIGDINSGVISSTGRQNVSTTIPGSFQNISP